jgi:hypothetical protein
MEQWTIGGLLANIEHSGTVGYATIGSWVFSKQWTKSIGKKICHNMDPSWSDIKCILHRHEETIEGNSVDLRQVTGKVGTLDQIVASLLQRIELLE